MSNRTADARRIRLPVIALNAIDRLYATIPSANCKGLCQECCGPVMMTRLEWDRITARMGKVMRPTPEQEAKLACPMLADDGKCSVYDIRPVVCRIWGVTPDMPCPFGCKPDPQPTADECWDVVRTADRIDREHYPETP